MKSLTRPAFLAVCLLLPAAGVCSEQQAKEQAAPPKFDLLEIQVDGNTVLPQTLVEKTLYPFLGTGKSVADVDKARQTLENQYRESGYPTVLVEIPEQDVVDNVVRFNVVEGQVESLKIKGSRYFRLDKMRYKVPALAVGKVPYMPKVQDQVSELGKESPDRQITPIFRAGDTPGKTEVELRVKDALPLHGSIEMNGRNSESTSRSRLQAAVRYDNLWQRFHSASLQFQVSPENYDEVEVWSGTYVLPLDWQDMRLALYGIGISSNTQLGTNLGSQLVVGTGEIFGARLIRPLSGFNAYSHSLTLGVDYKSFNQGVSQQGQDQGTSPVAYLPWLVSYDGNWRYPGVSTSLSTALHFAMDGAVGNAAEFEKRREFAKASFAYLTSELKHQRDLPWGTRFAGHLSGQITSTPLISNEQFAAGGPQSVRGYFQTQQLGDDGINFSAEWQSPLLKRQDWDFVQNLRAHVFFDYAYLWIKSPLAPNPDHYQLAGTGAGLRLQMFRHWLGELDWAFPLERQSTVAVGSQRVDFKLAYEF